MSGSITNRPYNGLRVVPGVMSADVGQVSAANITKAQVSSGAYTITFTTAHPHGADYLVFVQPRTSSSTNGFFTCTATQASTVLIVWCRDLTNTVVSGNSHIHTVP